MWFVELVKAVLSWPVAAVIVALGYKPEILAAAQAVMSRTWKGKFKGFGVEAEIDVVVEQQKTTEVTVAVDPDTIELKELAGLSRTTAMANIERILHARLTGVDPDARVDVLVRNLAQAQLEAAFGIVYSVIFGSQIAGLVQLSARRRVPADEAYRFYVAEAEQKYPQVYANYRFAGWLGFLREHGLIVQQGDAVAITELGDDFLLWLRAKNLKMDRPL